jgi:hypothetical protein
MKLGEQAEDRMKLDGIKQACSDVVRTSARVREPLEERSSELPSRGNETLRVIAKSGTLRFHHHWQNAGTITVGSNRYTVH